MAAALSILMLTISPSSAKPKSASQGGVNIVKEVTLASKAEAALAPPSGAAQSRGELLYTTHCISCHTTQMHWRDNRSANNWANLKVQVRRWQGAASLGWSENDIEEVSRYLNESIYRFDVTAGPVSLHGQDGDVAPLGALSLGFDEGLDDLVHAVVGAGQRSSE